jgi:hypothetical protein
VQEPFVTIEYILLIVYKENSVIHRASPWRSIDRLPYQSEPTSAPMYGLAQMQRSPKGSKSMSLN